MSFIIAKTVLKVPLYITKVITTLFQFLFIFKLSSNVAFTFKYCTNYLRFTKIYIPAICFRILGTIQTATTAETIIEIPRDRRSPNADAVHLGSPEMCKLNTEIIQSI